MVSGHGRPGQHFSVTIPTLLPSTIVSCPHLGDACPPPTGPVKDLLYLEQFLVETDQKMGVGGPSVRKVRACFGDFLGSPA